MEDNVFLFRPKVIEDESLTSYIQRIAKTNFTTPDEIWKLLMKKHNRYPQSSTKIPIMFMGLKDSTRMLIENKQLGSRVLNRYELKSFNYGDDTFRAILYFFDESIPLKSKSNLLENDLWQYIFFATDGRLGYVKILLKEATKIALEHNSDLITTSMLAEAFHNKLYSIIGDNPFLPGYDLEKAKEKLKKSNSL